MKLMNEHGGNIYKYDHQIIDFSANINPFGLSATARASAESALADIDNYPDPNCTALLEAIAHHESMPTNCISCGNGAADIIYRIVFSKKPRRALLPAPTFSEYEAALRCVGCELEYYFLLEENDFILDENILTLIPEADIVFICNPNNPTGQLVSKSLISRIASVALSANTTLVVDECFLDFVENSELFSAKELLAINKNIVIVKAFTKIYAMPGIRLGYSLSSPKDSQAINAHGATWAVNTVAQACGQAVLLDHKYIEKTHRFVSSERGFLVSELENLGFKIFKPSANYIFLKSKALHLKERLIPMGILIRDCSNYKGLYPGFYRVAVKSRSDNEVLIKCLKHLQENFNVLF